MRIKKQMKRIVSSVVALSLCSSIVFYSGLSYAEADSLASSRAHQAAFPQRPQTVNEGVYRFVQPDRRPDRDERIICTVESIEELLLQAKFCSQILISPSEAIIYDRLEKKIKAINPPRSLM